MVLRHHRSFVCPDSALHATSDALVHILARSTAHFRVQLSTRAAQSCGQRDGLYELTPERWAKTRLPATGEVRVFRAAVFPRSGVSRGGPLAPIGSWSERSDLHKETMTMGRFLP